MYDDHGHLLNVTMNPITNQTGLWQMLRDITNYGVWKVFGQVDPIGRFSAVFSSHRTNPLILVGTDTYSHTAFILAIIFVAIANVLLLNVLIALFK